MIYAVIALRDKVSKNFESINLDVSEATAKRNFSFAVNNSKELLFKAKDLELYHIGDFETEKGLFSAVVPMIRICSGDEVIINE